MNGPLLTVYIAPVALSRENAARALDMSLDSFERYVQPELRLIRKGRLRLVPRVEIEKWAERNAEHVLGEPNQRRAG